MDTKVKVIAHLRHVLLLVFLLAPMGQSAHAGMNDYPRIMAMSIGKKNYDDPSYLSALATVDVAVLGFYPGWHGNSGQSIDSILSALHQKNPSLLIGQYTIVTEAYNDAGASATEDITRKLNVNNWWLRDSQGRMLQWTTQYHAWDINITDWTKTDSDQLHYPEWLNRRNYNVLFKEHPGIGLWYFDGVDAIPRDKVANWRGTGQDEDSSAPNILAAFRTAQAEQWADARRIAPHLVLLGNSDNDLSSLEFKSKLNGAFLEGLMGAHWSIDTREGWAAAMTRYRAAMANTLSPHLVGFNVWGAPSDYRFMRFALASCLMDDGYFSFTDPTTGYGSPLMFDEYRISLGRPIDPPQQAAWQEGVYRRRFEGGVVLANPTATAQTIELGEGYAHFAGKQDRVTNNGQLVEELALGARDGVILVNAARGARYWKQ